MGEDFLNSYAFEQMAREYNRKYSSRRVDTLSLKKDDELLLKVENIFNKVFRLFYLLKKEFRFDKRFKELFLEFDCLKQESVQKYSLLFNKSFNFSYLGYNKNVNSKVCICLLLEIFNEIFDYDNSLLNNIFNKIIEEKNDLILENDLLKENSNINKQILSSELLKREKEIHNEINKIFKRIIDLFMKIYSLI